MDDVEPRSDGGRLIVERSISDALVGMLVAKARNIRIGDPSYGGGVMAHFCVAPCG